MKRSNIGFLAAMLGAAFGIAPLAADPISAVDFEQSGPEKLPVDQLRLVIKSRPGLEYSRETLNDDVKRLYDTGNLTDVAPSATRTDDGKIRIVFRTKSTPRILQIRYEGNAKFPPHELAAKVTLAEGGLLNQKQLRESTAALRKFYTEKGYRDALVFPAIIPDGKGGVILSFKIDEKLRLKVNDVVFEGSTKFSQWDLRHSISNQFSYINYIPLLNDYLNFGLLDRRELELDRARLRDKYHDIGYLDFRIKDVSVTPSEKDPEYVNIKFELEEGEPYTVSEIALFGNTVIKTEEIMEQIRLKNGETFSSSREDASCRAILSLYETLGYADVVCRAQRTADPASHTVKVAFQLREGRKYHVRDVVIVGNTDTKEKVIRRELAIQPGDPVDKNRIEISRQRLLGMGYFTQVEATPVNADAADEKDVRFSVEEKPVRYNFRIGAGASDVNSVFGMAEISCENFDITNPTNLFYGGGQRMRLQGIYGIDNAGFNVDFVEPWLFDLPIRFELSGYMNLVEYENWDEWRVGARTSIQRKIFDDFTTIALGYKFEVVRVNNVDSRLKDYFKEEGLSGTFRVSQPSLMIGRDTRDSIMDPTEGYNINFFSSITPMALGSSSNYYRIEGKGSYYVSFFDKAIVAMVGAKLGTVSSFNRDDENVPVFERYFMGGSDSLRGFEYRTVAPTYNREAIGGQTMLLLTAEVTHPIWGPVRGAIFVDAGNAWRNSWSMAFSGINIGAGYGLRVRLPWINVPLKLDLAYPVLNNTDCESSKFRIHFNVGFTF